jgi:hypothetical protein
VTRVPEGGRSNPVGDAARTLAGYILILEGLLAEPVADGAAGAVTSRGASSPEPWNTAAGQALMDAWEGVPRLEAGMRYALTGKPGPRRGGSEGNFADALGLLQNLAAGMTPEDADKAARALWRWVDEARAVHGIDERRRLRHLPRKPGGGLPPRCPRCLCFCLVADLDARVVYCQVYGCEDRNGLPPVASMIWTADGRPGLAWADGLTEIVPGFPDDDDEGEP